MSGNSTTTAVAVTTTTTLSTFQTDYYPLVNLIANIMRSFTLGFAACIILTTCTLSNPISQLINIFNKSFKSSAHGRTSVLPFLSSMVLVGVLITSIAYDIVKPRCAGRTVSLYVFIYLSQICLEIHQTNRVRMLSRENVIARACAYSLFMIRATSLVCLCFFYDDLMSSTTRICGTVYPFPYVLFEKCILVGYNVGNLLILVYLQEQKKGFKGILSYFLFQDGMTFVVSFLLETMYVVVVGTVANPYIVSTASGLGAGFNMSILYFKYILEMRTMMTALVQHVTTTASVRN
ncbi:hypothetical protein HDU97_001041 [Phlyctochytrium planicorne]|nr:hypothetical protein HDU97_001041 [Phlyctochytrium planicorne]